MNKYVNNLINLSFRAEPVTAEEIETVRNGYNAENKTELLRVATKKKVLPVVGKFLCSINVDNEEWQKHYEHFLNRNKEVVKQVGEVFSHLKSKGIEKIAAYENFGALLYSDNDIALYSSGDVDLYADPSQKEVIISAMKELGYVPTDDINHKRNLMTEFLKKDALIRVNIGWKVLRRHSLPITVKAEDIVSWENLVYYKNTDIKLLSKEALLYLCLIRIAVHGYSRSPDVRLFIDIYNAVCCKPDWEVVLKWAQNDGLVTKMSTSAYLACHLNGVNVPSKILDIAENDKYAKKIIAITFDKKERSLKYDPSGFELIKLEAASDNKSVLGETLTILFPPKKWLMEFYREENNNTFDIYVNYYKRILKF